MNTKAQPTNAAETAEVDFGMQLVRRLVGGSVVAFGANENGEVYLSVKKEGQITEVLIGVDERGEPAVFEVERGEASNG